MKILLRLILVVVLVGMSFIAAVLADDSQKDCYCGKWTWKEGEKKMITAYDCLCEGTPAGTFTVMKVTDHFTVTQSSVTCAKEKEGEMYTCSFMAADKPVTTATNDLKLVATETTAESAKKEENNVIWGS